MPFSVNDPNASLLLIGGIRRRLRALVLLAMPARIGRGAIVIRRGGGLGPRLRIRRRATRIAIAGSVLRTLCRGGVAGTAIVVAVERSATAWLTRGKAGSAAGTIGRRPILLARIEAGATAWAGRSRPIFAARRKIGTAAGTGHSRSIFLPRAGTGTSKRIAILRIGIERTALRRFAGGTAARFTLPPPPKLPPLAISTLESVLSEIAISLPKRIELLLAEIFASRPPLIEAILAGFTRT